MHLEACSPSNTLLIVGACWDASTIVTCESLKEIIIMEKQSLEEEIAEAERAVRKDKRRYRHSSGSLSNTRAEERGKGNKSRKLGGEEEEMILDQIFRGL